MSKKSKQTVGLSGSISALLRDRHGTSYAAIDVEKFAKSLLGRDIVSEKHNIIGKIVRVDVKNDTWYAVTIPIN